MYTGSFTDKKGKTKEAVKTWGLMFHFNKGQKKKCEEVTRQRKGGFLALGPTLCEKVTRKYAGGTSGSKGCFVYQTGVQALCSQW